MLLEKQISLEIKKGEYTMKTREKLLKEKEKIENQLKKIEMKEHFKKKI